MNKSFDGMTLAKGFPVECWIAHMENNKFIYGGSTFDYDLKKYSLSKYQTDTSFIHSKFDDVKRNRRPILNDGKKESFYQTKLRSQSVGNDKAVQTGVKNQTVNSSKNNKNLEGHEIRNEVPFVSRRNTREITNPLVNLSQKYSDFLSDILDENNSASLDLEESLRISSNPITKPPKVPPSSNPRTSSSSINTNTENKNYKKPDQQANITNPKDQNEYLPQNLSHETSKPSNPSNPALKLSEPHSKPINSKNSSHSNLSNSLNQLNTSGIKNDSIQSIHSRALSNANQPNHSKTPSHASHASHANHSPHQVHLNNSHHSIHTQDKSISPTSQSIHSKLGQFVQDSKSSLNHSNSMSQIKPKIFNQQDSQKFKRHSIEVRIPSSQFSYPQNNQIEFNAEPDEFRKSELNDSKNFNFNEKFAKRRQSESFTRSEILDSSKSSPDSSIHKISRSEIAFEQVKRGKVEGSLSRSRSADRSSSQDVKISENEVNHWTKYVSDTNQDLRTNGGIRKLANSRSYQTANPLFSYKSPLEYYHSLGISSPTLGNPYKKNLKRRKNDTVHYQDTFNSKLRSSYTQAYTYN